MQIDKVSIFCFFASYVVALGLELTQFMKTSRVNRWAAIGFTSAGLVAQTMYLVHRSRLSHMPPLIGSMHDWLLVLAWVAAAVYVVLELRDRRLGLGVFLLPLVLLLVSSSTSMKREPRVRDAQYAVEMFHASLLVFGIAGVTIGFLLSLMYLVQHNRLRHKTPDPDSLQLYSLERLGRMNWWAVVGSVPLLTLGMLAGVCLAWKSKATATPVDLAAPGFVVMYVLWLAMIVLLGWLVSRSQSSGKIVAWRTLWACGFLLVTMLCLEMFTGGIHGKKPDRGTGTSARPSHSMRLIHHGGTEARRPEADFRIQRKDAKAQSRKESTLSTSFAPLRLCAFAMNSSSRVQTLPDRIEHHSVPPCLRGDYIHVEDGRANGPVPRPPQRLPEARS